MINNNNNNDDDDDDDISRERTFVKLNSIVKDNNPMGQG